VQYFCGTLRKISQQILVKHINCHVQRENAVTFFVFKFQKVVQQHIAGDVEIVYIENFPMKHLVKGF